MIRVKRASEVEQENIKILTHFSSDSNQEQSMIQFRKPVIKIKCKD